MSFGPDKYTRAVISIWIQNFTSLQYDYYLILLYNIGIDGLIEVRSIFSLLL